MGFNSEFKGLKNTKYKEFIKLEIMYSMPNVSLLKDTYIRGMSGKQ